MKITMIAAIDQNFAIGKDNTLAWRIPSDLQRFKEYTIGKPLVMGYNTFASLPGILPGRPHIVYTTKQDLTEVQNKVDMFKQKYGEENLPLIVIVNSDLAFIDAINEFFSDAEEICIVGGGQIYRKFYHLSEKLVITSIGCKIIDPDVYFPRFNKTDWHNEACIASDQKGPKDEFSYSVWEYERSSAPIYNISTGLKKSKIDIYAQMLGVKT